MAFEVSLGLQQLANQCKRRVIEPSVYEDYAEQYVMLYCPADIPENSWIRYKFLTLVRDVRGFYDALDGTVINAIALCLQAVRNTLTAKRKDAVRIIYPVDVVVMVILFAKLRGNNTCQQIANFYKKHYLELVAVIDGIPGPSHMLSASAIKRTMRLLSADEINELLIKYFKPNKQILERLLESGEQRERPAHAMRPTIGFDGQEVTEFFCRGEPSPRCKVARGDTAFNCTSKQVISAKTVTKKNNEADAFIEMLPNLGVADGIFYADALNTSAKVSNAILKSGGDFLFNIKNNAGNKELLNHITAIFNREYAKGDKSDIVSRQHVEKGHGRIDQTTINILAASKLDKRIKNEHKGVATLVHYIKESTYLINGTVTRTTSNSRYYISSLERTEANADQILYSILDYWSIEQHHSRVDDPNVFNQDATQSCTFDYTSNLIGINKVAYNILSWIRQEMIRTSKKKSYRPSYALVQEILAEDTVFDLLIHLSKYYMQLNEE